MSLSVTPKVGRLDLSWSLPEGTYASVVGWRKRGTSAWYQMSPPWKTAVSLSSLESAPYELQVLCLGVGSTQNVLLTATATPLAALTIAICNSTGFGQQCDDLFSGIRVNTERLDIGQGDFGLTDVAIARGKKVLPMFAAGTNGNLTVNGQSMSPEAIGVAIAAVVPQLRARSALVGDGGVPVLELGNEVYQTLGGRDYGAMYHAARVAAAGQVKLLAVASTPAWSAKHGGSGNWFADFQAGLLRAGGSVADIDGWTVHPYPADTHTVNANLTDVLQSGDYAGQGWPMIKTLHDQALATGFRDVGWWITETGMTRDAGLDVQARLVGAMLDAARLLPYVRFIAIYAACDDTERYGVLTGAAPNLVTTPAFAAIGQRT